VLSRPSADSFAVGQSQKESLWPEQSPEPGRDLADILPETITGLKKIKKKGSINELLLTASLYFCLFSTAPA
jgi:hypothetical protein